MKKGFTMIELIFVIVIIGILAAVAIPKLSATRDDAKIATAASEVGMAVSDIGAYYTAHGKLAKLGDMTNVVFYTSSSSSAVANDANGTDMNSTTIVYYNVPKDKGCISFKGSVTDGNLTVATVSNTASVCKGVQTAVKKLLGTHKFGGSSVNFN